MDTTPLGVCVAGIRQRNIILIFELGYDSDDFSFGGLWNLCNILQHLLTGFDFPLH